MEYSFWRFWEDSQKFFLCEDFDTATKQALWQELKEDNALRKTFGSR